MWSYVMPAILISGLVTAVAIGRSTPEIETTQKAQAQVDAYKVFMYTADQYFKANPAPGAALAYTWSTIKSSAPPAMKDAGIPSHWKAVRSVDGTWVACTEMSETAAAQLPTLFPAQTVPSGSSTIALLPQSIPTTSISNVVNGGGLAIANGTPNYVVIGQAAAAATVSANLCSSI